MCFNGFSALNVLMSAVRNLCVSHSKYGERDSSAFAWNVPRNLLVANHEEESWIMLS